MATTDPIAEMFTSLRNAAAVGKMTISLPTSKLKERIAAVLKDQGFLAEVQVDGKGIEARLVLQLKVDENGRPVLHSIRRISKPGQRIYTSYRDLRRVRQGLGLSLLTTPKGILTDSEARKQRVGGEVIAELW